MYFLAGDKEDESMLVDMLKIVHQLSESNQHAQGHLKSKIIEGGKYI